jgi:putative spermidine/putrescine transport system permease protein
MSRRLLIFLASLLLLFPFAWLGLMSLMQGWRFPALLPEQWRLTPWQQFLQGQNRLAGSLVLSLLISLTVATTSTLAGFFTARFVAFSSRRKMWLLLAYFPFVLAPVVYAAVLYFYFIVLGLSGSIAGVMLGQVMIAYPYAVILFSGYWNQRLRDMEFLVYTLGGSRWTAFRRVLLPVSQGILLVGFFQTFLISWFEYGLTRLIGVGKVQTLTIEVYQFVQEANPYLAALSSVLLFMPPLVLLWVNKRYVFGRGDV